MQFAALSNRPEVPLDKALEASLYPANLASLAVANVMGSLETTQVYWGPNYDTLPEVGATDRSFNYLFVGAASTIVVLWFGIAGGWLARRGNSADGRRAAGRAALRAGPLYAASMRSPSSTCRASTCSAGRSTAPSCWWRLGPPRGAAAGGLRARGRPARCASGASPRSPPVRSAIVGWAVLFSERSHHGWDRCARRSKVVPMALLVIAVLARARDARQRSGGGRLRRGGRHGRAHLVQRRLEPQRRGARPTTRCCSSRQAPTRRPWPSWSARSTNRHRQGERPRVEVVGVSGSWQNLAMARGLEATNGYNPLRIGSYDRLVSPGETTHIVDQRLFPGLLRRLRLRAGARAGPANTSCWAGRSRRCRIWRRRPVSDVLLAGPKVWIYRLRGRPSRACKLHQARVMVADTDAQVRAGQFRVNPAAETALIEDGTAPSRNYWPTIAAAEDGRARIVSWRPDRMEVEVDSEQPGHPGGARGLLSGLGRRGRRPAGAHPAHQRAVPRRGGERGPPRVVFRFAPFSLSNLRDALVGVLAKSP